LVNSKRPTAAVVLYLPLAGALLALVTVVGWMLLWTQSKTAAFAVLAGLSTLFYAGKEAGLPVGIVAGAEPVTMGLFIFFADAAATCFIYPPLHVAIRKGMERPDFLGRYLRFVRDRGLERRGLISRYGTAGLFVFMLIPFALNGPLFGAVLGRMMGLRAAQIVPTLLLAIGATTILWTTIYSLGFSIAATIDDRLPKLIAAAIIVLVLANTLWSFHRMRREPRRADPGETPTV
jgi:uncharacterized membrane protein